MENSSFQSQRRCFGDIRVCLVHRETGSVVIQIGNQRQEKVLVRCCDSCCYEINLLCRHKVNHLTYKDNMAQVVRDGDIAAVLVIVFADPAGSEASSALQQLWDSCALLNVCVQILCLHPATEQTAQVQGPVGMSFSTYST